MSCGFDGLAPGPRPVVVPLDGEGVVMPGVTVVFGVGLKLPGGVGVEPGAAPGDVPGDPAVPPDAPDPGPPGAAARRLSEGRAAQHQQGGGRRT